MAIEENYLFISHSSVLPHLSMIIHSVMALAKLLSWMHFTVRNVLANYALPFISHFPILYPVPMYTPLTDNQPVSHSVPLSSCSCYYSITTTTYTAAFIPSWVSYRETLGDTVYICMYNEPIRVRVLPQYLPITSLIHLFYRNSGALNSSWLPCGGVDVEFLER